jgi:putative membrane protein
MRSRWARQTERSMFLVVRWIINALALMLLPYIFTSIQVSNFYTALVTALILGLINAMIRPLLILLTLPVTILTLGFFILVINGLMFWFVASLIRGFVVAGFWPAFWGAIVYSVISWALSALVLGRPGASRK